MNAMMRVLRQAGIGEATARSAYGAVHTYTIGFAALEASRARQAPGSEDVSNLARQLAAYTTTGQFTEGLRYLLEGINSHAGTRQGTGQTTSRAPRRRPRSLEHTGAPPRAAVTRRAGRMAALSRELCGALAVPTDVIGPAQLHGLVNNPGITDLGDRIVM
jgi:hypothetical protein